MIRFACLAAALLLATDAAGQVSGLLPSPPQAPARDNPAARVGTSSIRGRIVEDETGQPVARAVVRIMSPALGPQRSAFTNQEGRYEFSALPAGTYTLNAQKPTFVTVNYGQRRADDFGSKPIEVADKASVDLADVRLPRGGVITGTIVDEYGAPVPNAFVQAMLYRYINGQKRPNFGASVATTPDTGEFRLWGLRPGEYTILASARSMYPNEVPDDRSGYANTYYPSTANPEQAQTIRVGAGQVVASIVIPLVPVRTARVSGIALGADGAPLRNGYVSATMRIGSTILPSSSPGGSITQSGTFVIPALPPGDWMIRANPAAPAGGEPGTASVAMVTVSGGDIDGVVLAPMPLVRVRGRMLFSNQALAAAIQPAAIRINMVPTDPVPMSFGRIPPPVVNEDFSFTAEGPPGSILIRASVAGPGSWTLRAIRHNSTDITDHAIAFGPGDMLDGIEIELTDVNQTIKGVVTDAKGEPARAVAVYVFSQRPERWFPPSRFATVAMTDKNGQYSVRSLPPDHYYAIALDYLDSNRRAGDADYVEELTRHAIRLSLDEGENKTLDLKLSNAP